MNPSTEKLTTNKIEVKKISPGAQVLLNHFESLGEVKHHPEDTALENRVKDDLVGSTELERFDSFIQTQFNEEGAEKNQVAISEARKEIETSDYYKDIEHVKHLYSSKPSQRTLAYDFLPVAQEFGGDVEKFLQSTYPNFTPRIREGYFYKELVKSINEVLATINRGVGLLG